MTREEVDEQLAVIGAAFAETADDMVALLLDHSERTWANTDRLSMQLEAQNDRAYRQAIQTFQSFFGGMGSWNDFYMQVLGEAEEQRTALTGQLWRLNDQLIEVLESAPAEPNKCLEPFIELDSRTLAELTQVRYAVCPSRLVQLSGRAPNGFIRRRGCQSPLPMTSMF